MRRPRTLIALFVVAAAVLAYFVVDSILEQRHPGGDPKSVVFNTMKGIQEAVPTDATNVEIHAYKTQWVPGCPEISQSHAGWTKESVYVTFSDHDPADHVEHDIAGSLEKAGWRSSPIRITKGQGLVPHWLRNVRAAQPVDAFAFAAPAGSSAWFLSAAWQPRPSGDECP